MDMGVPLTAEQARSSSARWSTSSSPGRGRSGCSGFLDADVCAVEHLRPTEVFDKPQARHNEMVVTVDDPVLGPVEQVAPRDQVLGDGPGLVARRAPPGEHTDDVLASGEPAGRAPSVRRRPRPMPGRCSTA